MPTLGDVKFFQKFICKLYTLSVRLTTHVDDDINFFNVMK